MPVGRRTSRSPPPPAAPRAATPLQDQRCGVGQRRGQLRRSPARVATTSAGVAPFAGGHWPRQRVFCAQTLVVVVVVVVEWLYYSKRIIIVRMG